MTTEEKLIKNKLGLLELATYLKNVSEACRVIGFSRDTFYRGKKAYEEGGVEALKEKSRRKPNAKNRVPEEVEQEVLRLALEEPSLGQKRVSDTLRQNGIFISPAGVRCVWLRHQLETFQKRLKGLEEHVAKTGAVLTEAHLRALEKAKEEKAAWGEIETEHVGGQVHHCIGNVVRLPNLGQRHGRNDFADCYGVAELGCAARYHRPSGANAIDPSTAIIPGMGGKA